MTRIGMILVASVVLMEVWAGLEIDLPLVGEKAYSASVPFDLEIDVNARTVLDWSVDFDSAKVEEN